MLQHCMAQFLLAFLTLYGCFAVISVSCREAWNFIKIKNYLFACYWCEKFSCIAKKKQVWLGHKNYYFYELRISIVSAFFFFLEKRIIIHNSKAIKSKPWYTSWDKYSFPLQWKRKRCWTLQVICNTYRTYEKRHLKRDNIS